MLNGIPKFLGFTCFLRIGWKQMQETLICRKINGFPGFFHGFSMVFPSKSHGIPWAKPRETPQVFGTELASAEDAAVWSQEKRHAPPDAEIDPWGHRELRRHLAVPWERSLGVGEVWGHFMAFHGISYFQNWGFHPHFIHKCDCFCFLGKIWSVHQEIHG